MERLTAILARIDEANAFDPNVELTPDGPEPAALLYGRRMTQMMRDFAPSASEALQIAARGQHIERWTRPRADYPEGREGYLNWRRDATRYHASRICALMAQTEYDSTDMARVSALISKADLKTDHDAQTLEDVACLVFFRWYANAFSAKHAPDQVMRIVGKTARKMSAPGRAVALTLGLPSQVAAAIAAVR